MPDFSGRDKQRIVNTVQSVERMVADNSGRGPMHYLEQGLSWYRLTEEFDPDTHEAVANPGKWLPDDNDNDGQLTAEITTCTVRDTTEQCGAGEGDWVLCRPIGSRNGTVLEIVSAGKGLAKRCKCQLTGALTAATASCTVDTVTPTDGGQNPVANSTSATLTAHIQLNPSSSGGYAGADNTVCYIELHEDDGYWWIYDMPCSA